MLSQINTPLLHPPLQNIPGDPVTSLLQIHKAYVHRNGKLPVRPQQARECKELVHRSMARVKTALLFTNLGFDNRLKPPFSHPGNVPSEAVSYDTPVIGAHLLVPCDTAKLCQPRKTDAAQNLQRISSTHGAMDMNGFLPNSSDPASCQEDILARFRSSSKCSLHLSTTSLFWAKSWPCQLRIDWTEPALFKTVCQNFFKVSQKSFSMPSESIHYI